MALHDLHFQGETVSYYVFAIRKIHRRRMSAADLPRLARLPPRSLKYVALIGAERAQ